MRGAILLVLVAACSSDDEPKKSASITGHTSPHASCQAIIDACHAKDVGDGPVHDCHDVASASSASEASCGAKKDECVRTCTSRDAGT